jgi:hypothetical protein
MMFMNPNDDAFGKRLLEIEKSLKSADGEQNFNDSMAAVKRAGGIPADFMQRIAERPDAANVIGTLGREALLAECSKYNEDAALSGAAEKVYSRIREKERSEWRKMKGRS